MFLFVELQSESYYLREFKNISSTNMDLRYFNLMQLVTDWVIT